MEIIVDVIVIQQSNTMFFDVAIFSLFTFFDILLSKQCELIHYVIFVVASIFNRKEKANFAIDRFDATHTGVCWCIVMLFHNYRVVVLL